MAIENQTFDTVNNIQIPVTTIPWAGATGGAQAVTNRDPITGVGQTIDASGAAKVDGSGVTQPISGSVSVTNFPGTQAVTVGNFPATQAVSGSVDVSNPAGPGRNSAGTGQFVPVADSCVKIDESANATTTLVDGVSGKSIYVCSYVVMANGTGTIQWAYGATPIPISGAMAVTAETGISQGCGFGAVLIIPAGQDLKIVVGAEPVQGHLTYAQF